MPGYIYIISSETSGRHYLGSTNNTQRRLAQHNANAVRATKNRGPWRLIKVVEFSNIVSARRAEQHIKKQKKNLVEVVRHDGYDWAQFS